jgi:isoquinoline 1-oxidoreductase alpha subunit
MIKMTINGETHEVDVEENMPLLWVLREELGLRGTKFGCGLGVCGACTIHVNGRAVRSCVTPAQAAVGNNLTTIEGLGTRDAPHAIQKAWLKHQVPQCGYCQCGMQMAVATFLESNIDPTDDDIDAAITNICRCGCYERIRTAIKDAVAELRGGR